MRRSRTPGVTAAVLNIGGDLVIRGSVDGAREPGRPAVGRREQRARGAPAGERSRRGDQRRLPARVRYCRPSLLPYRGSAHRRDHQPHPQRDRDCAAARGRRRARDRVLRARPRRERRVSRPPFPARSSCSSPRKAGAIASPGWQRVQARRSPVLTAAAKPAPSPSPAPQFADAGMELSIALEMAQNGGFAQRPYVAVWIEDKDKFPVRTLALWYQKAALAARPAQLVPRRPHARHGGGKRHHRVRGQRHASARQIHAEMGWQRQCRQAGQARQVHGDTSKRRASTAHIRSCARKWNSTASPSSSNCPETRRSRVRPSTIAKPRINPAEGPQARSAAPARGAAESGVETESRAVVALAAHLSVDGELRDRVLLRGHRADAQSSAVVREAAEERCSTRARSIRSWLRRQHGETRNRGVPALASQDLERGERFPRGRRAGVRLLQRSGIRSRPCSSTARPARTT